MKIILLRLLNKSLQAKIYTQFRYGEVHCQVISKVTLTEEAKKCSEAKLEERFRLYEHKVKIKSSWKMTSVQICKNGPQG